MVKPRKKLSMINNIKLGTNYPLWGGHVSIAGSIELAFDRAESINTTAMQIFTKSNRQWNSKQLTEEDIEKFQKRWDSSTVKYINVHAAYLINLCSDKQETREKSFKALMEEAKRCKLLGIKDLVLHPGSSNADTKESLKMIGESILKTIEAYPEVRILIENMAGQGNSIGSSFENISEIIKFTGNENIGVCLDTCHAFAYGYNINNISEIIKKNLDLEMIKLIHLNDSSKDIGSKVDRHAHWDEGLIGLKNLNEIINNNYFINIPKILETPKSSDETEFIKDLELMGKLYKYKIDKNCPLSIYQLNTGLAGD